MSIAEAKRQTKWALFWSSILHEPLFTLYGFVAFILYRDLGATAFQIALLTMLKPVVTVLSFYWSAGSRGKLRVNLLGAGILMRAPFLLCPWIDSAWFVIGAAVNYMFFYRAGAPSWLEVLRRNVPEGERGKAFSWSAALGYGEGVVLSVAMGALLDHEVGMWKGLFVGAALIGMIGTLVQARVPVEEVVERTTSWRELVVRPWRDSWRLMREKRDFAFFQWGFMAAGFGLMFFQPALPLFMVDELGITYTEMAAAVSIAKGLGFMVSSPGWGQWMQRQSIHVLASGVFLAFGLFPFLLVMSKWGLVWFYAAYFWYGVAQGGSHLVWNLSGPHFAKDEPSAKYTGVNVVMAGLRGAVAPPLGGWMSMGWGALPVLALGGTMCLVSGLGMLAVRFRKSLSNQS